MSETTENNRVMDNTSIPSTSVFREKNVLELPTNENKSNWIDNKESMELRTNASTDDLLFLESGNQTPEQVHTNLNAANSPPLDNTEQVSEAVTPSVTPSSSVRRKSRNNALRLNLDSNTWSKPEGPAKPAATAKFRQNLQAGAAKVSAVVQKGKTPEFRFRFILVVLFGSIIGLVTFTWYLYQHQMMQLAFGDKIRFHETQRLFHLLKADGQIILAVDVGMQIPSELKSFDCKLLYPIKGPNICQEWKYRARLHINYSHSELMSCYTVHWESLATNTPLRDCISLAGAHWYGMGEVKNISWPLSGISEKPQPFVTGDLERDDYGAILERYWLSSEGVALKVGADIPLYVSLNSSMKNTLCLEAKYDSFPYYNDKSDNLHLDYTICTGTDMKQVHKGMWDRDFRRGNVTMEFLEVPIWATAPKLEYSLTQESLQTYSNHIMDHGFPAGFLLIDTKWQKVEGDLSFNPMLFPNPTEILNILHNKGFKVLLAVHPYVCLGADVFRNATDDHYFVSDEKRQVPLLTRWKNEVCAIVDVTRNTSEQWFYDRIVDVKTTHGIDGFLFTGGQSSFLPPYYYFYTMSVNPDNFLSLYLRLASKTSDYLGVSVGFHSQHISAFVRLAPRTSTWDANTGLKSIIPAVLTLGLLGYPLVNPGSVGGDVFVPSNTTMPDKELYIRWLQLAAFMPVVQLSIPPGDYDLDVIKAAKFMFKVRSERILQSKQPNEYIKRVINEYHESGAPIVRPLWWLAPKDVNAQIIDSQFAVGNDLIVAPVLEEGKRARDVYLPPGRWRDELFGTSRLGGKWIYNYSVPLDKVAYFVKIED
ncbi:myogenesis-regulating glycosidase [Parasteatoda tepidariorum]|uniref:myogenesis-regulating glycosidase n=1 Tax=Parasteatoda tepidariorum TaxID=114398 RepID=UPI00077FBB76|nr:myogenesis-regulating glycosidase [Parasteatoda tepidariorum]